MSEELKTIITESQAIFQANPEKALATFEVQTRLGEGLHSKATVRDFAPLDIDEPPALGGTDQGPNPVEGAIVKSCVWADHAAARSWRSPSTNLTPRMISARWFDPSSFLHFL